MCFLSFFMTHEVPQQQIEPIVHATFAERGESMSRLTVADLTGAFRAQLQRGEAVHRIPESGGSITPININDMIPGLPDDVEVMWDGVNDHKVIIHIEDMEGTTREELADMARSIWKNPGSKVRFAVRGKDGKALGTVNAASIDGEIVRDNPGMHPGMLKGKRLTAELAYYHKEKVPGNEPILINVDSNRCAEATRKDWLHTLTSKEFRRNTRAFKKERNATIELIRSISTGRSEKFGDKTVLTTPFALGYAAMVNNLIDTAAISKGIQPNDVKFLLYVDIDPPNLESLRMLMPFGAKIEGICKYHSPSTKDPNRILTRLVLSQEYAGLRAFSEYAKSPESYGIDINPPTNFESRPYHDTEPSRRWNTDRMTVANERLSLYEEQAAPVIDAMYEKTFAVRDGDRLMIVADSGTALDSIVGVARRAMRNSKIKDVQILYMRTQEMDDITTAQEWLTAHLSDQLGAHGTVPKIAMHDMMSTREAYRRGLLEYWKNEPTFSISFQADDYQIRFAKLAPMARLFGPQALSPQITLKEFTSTVFSAEQETMARKANAYMELVKDAKSIQYVDASDPSGETDFTFYPRNPQTSETDNRYDTRRNTELTLREISGQPKDQHSTDNIPVAEIWTNLEKTATNKSHGRLSLRLWDTEISAQALAREEITAEEVAEINYSEEAVYAVVEDGYIVRIEGTGKRAELLRRHFELSSEHDNDALNNDGIHRVNRWIAEPGAGLNPNVTPQDVLSGMLPTIVTEKGDGWVHFGIGNDYDPNCPADQESKSHLDFGLVGRKLTMVITKTDGRVIELQSDEYGRFDWLNAPN
jgi:hypothetical protein